MNGGIPMAEQCSLLSIHFTSTSLPPIFVRLAIWALEHQSQCFLTIFVGICMVALCIMEVNGSRARTSSSGLLTTQKYSSSLRSVKCDVVEFCILVTRVTKSFRGRASSIGTYYRNQWVVRFRATPVHFTDLHLIYTYRRMPTCHWHLPFFFILIVRVLRIERQ